MLLIKAGKPMPKSMGKCPFCEKKMIPKVIEANSFRRDKCQCSECGEIIYVCRKFGCKNYAKGSQYYDEELCPDCSEELASTVGKVGEKALVTVGGVLAAHFGKEIVKN